MAGISDPRGGMTTWTVRTQYASAIKDARRAPRPNGRKWAVGDSGSVNSCTDFVCQCGKTRKLRRMGTYTDKRDLSHIFQQSRRKSI